MARACIISTCTNHAVRGRSRCHIHGPASTREKNPEYNAQHQRFAKEVVAKAQGRCANPNCPYTVGPHNPLQGDHIQPLSMGGQVVRSNYQALCRKCNISKGGRNRSGGN